MQKEHYDKAYQKLTPEDLADENFIHQYMRENSESLMKFFGQYQQQFGVDTSGMSCLELGSGLGALSQFLSAKFQNFLGVDFSQEAVSRATQLHRDLDFLVLDVLKQKINTKFDFIVDSHLYHCLVSDQQRQNYLRFIKDHLKSGGRFLMECMVFQEQLQFPIGYYFDEDFVLSQDLSGESIPIRSIRKSLAIENDFQNSELNLNYFYFHNELSFHVFPDFPEHPAQHCPKTIRLAATL